MQRFYAQSLARELLPEERTAKCLRAIIPTKDAVEIVYNPACSTAHYRNLVTCARLWFCPVCAARITEQRAQELLRGISRWREEGGFVALLTFTLRHHQGDKLPVLLSAIRDAHRRFKSGAPFQRLRERYGWSGSVASLEVTYGDNGWHPHLHELVFFEPLAVTTWRKFDQDARKRWLTVLAAAGRDATWEHGLDIRDAETDVYDYVAKFGHLPKDKKWTLEREVVKGPTKRAHADGLTPWQLLMAYGEGDQEAGRLFQHYAMTFKGRNQLVWSRGFRAELGLGAEKSDDDLAAALPDELLLLGLLDRSQWRVILGHLRDLRGELLLVASTGDKNALMAFLARFGAILKPE